MNSRIWGHAPIEGQVFDSRDGAIAAVREGRFPYAVAIVTVTENVRLRDPFGRGSLREAQTRIRNYVVFHRDHHADGQLFASLADTLLDQEGDIFWVRFWGSRRELDELLETRGGFNPRISVFEEEAPAREAAGRREVDLAILPTERWFGEDDFGRESGTRPVCLLWSSDEDLLEPIRDTCQRYGEIEDQGGVYYLVFQSGPLSAERSALDWLKLYVPWIAEAPQRDEAATDA